MRHINGRAVRTALGTGAALVTLALALVLSALHTAPSDGPAAVPAGQALPAAATDPEEPGDIVVPKPAKPSDDEGSWVWDKVSP